MALTIIGTIAVAYIAILLTLTLAQGSFIYPAPRGPGADVPGFAEITYRTADGLDLLAGYKPAREGKPTVVYFHGNGADWQSSVVATDRLTPHGYGVLAAEYRGYRGNPGTPSERGLYEDGRAAVGWLRERGVDPEEIVLIGNSIGSGVATQLATEMQPRALVLISPFTSLPQVAGEKLWWLPVRLLLRDQYDNRSKLPGVDAPVLLLHGDADTLIPHHHSQSLAEARPDARLVIFPNAGHDLAWHDTAEREVLAFLEDIDAQSRNR